jgi:hypothetical protein
MARRWQLLGTVAGAVLRCGLAGAQMPIGSVSTLDATVTGASSVANDRAQIATSGTVVASDHAAYVQLFRGGSVKVCATSGVHLTAGAVAPAAVAGAEPAVPETAAPVHPPLMVALDRGAIEVHTSANASDILMTPDLRIGFSDAGPLDLRIRVGRNGDTCVENRVTGVLKHPTLRVASLFGNDSYDVLPGQHVLFERANLHEVVDNESSPCGCPEPAAKPAPAAETSAFPLKSAAQPAAVRNPFPADVSQGLAPPPPAKPAPPQSSPTPVATPLVYTGDSPAAKPAAPAPAPKRGFFYSLGRFFKHLF